MKIFLPSSEEIGDDFKTSFTFDDESERQDFSRWLNNMDISFIKAKLPCIIDGKMSQQTCLIINSEDEVLEKDSDDSNTNDVQVQDSEVTEEVVHDLEEEAPKPKKKKKKSHQNEDSI